MVESLQDRLDKSKDPLDMLIHSVATHPLSKQHKTDEMTRDFGRHHPSKSPDVHNSSASSYAQWYGSSRKQALQLTTSLIREIFDTELGLQGQQCPLQFFSAACKEGGVLAKCFNATVGEILKCGECGARLNALSNWSDNHVQMLKFDHNTTAVTLKSLILENVISAPIDISVRSLPQFSEFFGKGTGDEQMKFLFHTKVPNSVSRTVLNQGGDVLEYAHVCPGLVGMHGKHA